MQEINFIMATKDTGTYIVTTIMASERRTLRRKFHGYIPGISILPSRGTLPIRRKSIHLFHYI
jgi:hypothetical protein